MRVSLLGSWGGILASTWLLSHELSRTTETQRIPEHQQCRVEVSFYHMYFSSEYCPDRGIAHTPAYPCFQSRIQFYVVDTYSSSCCVCIYRNFGNHMWTLDCKTLGPEKILTLESKNTGVWDDRSLHGHGLSIYHVNLGIQFLPSYKTSETGFPKYYLNNLPNDENVRPFTTFTEFTRELLGILD